MATEAQLGSGGQQEARRQQNRTSRAALFGGVMSESAEGSFNKNEHPTKCTEDRQECSMKPKLISRPEQRGENSSIFAGTLFLCTVSISLSLGGRSMLTRNKQHSSVYN